MEDPRAAENLQVIRTLMERAALYRRALAPVSLAAGSLGLGAGILGWWADFDGARSFGLLWMVLFGCAVHAAGFFLHRGIKALGWVFALLGSALLLYVNARGHAAGLPSLRVAHLVMGASFGGLHLLYAAYLAATERKLA